MTGLLLAMMEPPPAIEEEFQDWYDTEHYPERATCEGFLTAHRFICIDGWPRYLALYDLADADVLRGAASGRAPRGCIRTVQSLRPRVTTPPGLL